MPIRIRLEVARLKFMPAASEIDDIFAGKVSKSEILSERPDSDKKLKKSKKKKHADDAVTTASDPAPSKKKSKKRKKSDQEDDAVGKVDALSVDEPKQPSKKAKGKEKAVDDELDEMTTKQKRARVVETVRDTSSMLGLASPAFAKEHASDKPSKSSKKKKETKGDDKSRFMDSRGTAPRELLSVFR